MRWMLIFLMAVLAMPALAQRSKSIVPDLDAEGQKGDMARAAQKKANERFSKADENSNGFLEKAEVTKHLPYVAENFGKYDKNGDGKLTWEEYVGHDKWKRESAK